MGLFGFGKERGIVDLGERYRRNKEKAVQMKKEADEEKAKTQGSSGGFFPFFAAAESSSSPSNPEPVSTNIENSGIDAVEKRRRLAKRLKDMTDRIEDLSNQVYKLQQRVDVLEKKERAGY